MIRNLRHDCIQGRGCIMITFAATRACRWGNGYELRGAVSKAHRVREVSVKPVVTCAANSEHTKTSAAWRFVESDQRSERGHRAIGRCPVSF